MKADRCLVAAVVFVSATLLAAAARPAALDEVARLFRAGQYRQARAMDPAALSSGRPGEAALWAMRLAESPASALELARDIVENPKLPLAVRVQAALDAASLAAPAVALGFLEVLIKSHDREALPGEVLVRAGLAASETGAPAQARALLEAVRPGDPAFGTACEQLGRLELGLGDNDRALEAFAAAAVQPDGVAGELGRWRILQQLGRTQEARAAGDAILRRAPSSLAALEIRAARQTERDIRPTPSLPPDIATGSAPAEASPGYTISLAEFTDRSEALVYLSSLPQEAPRVVIGEVRDGLGQVRYRVQIGTFAAENEARTEADRIRREFGLPARIVESGNQ